MNINVDYNELFANRQCFRSRIEIKLVFLNYQLHSVFRHTTHTLLAALSARTNTKQIAGI